MPNPYNEVTLHKNLSCTEQIDLFPAGKGFVHSGIWEAEANQTVSRSKGVKTAEVVKTLNIKLTRG